MHYHTTLNEKTQSLLKQLALGCKQREVLSPPKPSQGSGLEPSFANFEMDMNQPRIHGMKHSKFKKRFEYYKKKVHNFFASDT